MPARRRKGWVSAGRCAGPAPIPALRAAFAPPVRMRPREGVFEEKTRKRRSPDERHPDPDSPARAESAARVRRPRDGLTSTPPPHIAKAGPSPRPNRTPTEALACSCSAWTSHDGTAPAFPVTREAWDLRGRPRPRRLRAPSAGAHPPGPVRALPDRGDLRPALAPPASLRPLTTLPAAQRGPSAPGTPAVPDSRARRASSTGTPTCRRTPPASCRWTPCSTRPPSAAA